MDLIDLPLEDSPYLLDRHGPIFILGCPRSGTTFLSECIGQIGGVEEFVGAIVPPRMMHLVGFQDEQGEDVGLYLKCIRDIFWQCYVRRRYFRQQRLAQLFYRNISLGEFLRKPTMEGSTFCYKEPFMCFAAPAFARSFPKAKFVHIIRDGRDNADSMLRSYPHALSDEVLSNSDLADNKVSEIGIPRPHGSYLLPWWVGEKDAESFVACSKYGRNVWMWREMVERARKAGVLLGDARYLEVRYEDFVREPLAQAEKILHFLGADFGSRLRSKLGKAHTGSVGVGSKRQSTERLAEASAIAGGLLSELGYQ